MKNETANHDKLQPTNHIFQLTKCYYSPPWRRIVRASRIKTIAKQRDSGGHIASALQNTGYGRLATTGRLERELQMVQLSATRCSCIAILWVSLVSSAAITPLCYFSTSVCSWCLFRYDSVPKLLDTPSYICYLNSSVKNIHSNIWLLGNIIRRIFIKYHTVCKCGLQLRKLYDRGKL
jgi:hypothetical protein